MPKAWWTGSRAKRNYWSNSRNSAEVPEYEDETIRELLEHPYRIIYRTGGPEVEILSVVHGARLLPPNVPGDG